MSLEIFYEENKNKLVHKLTGYSGDNEAARDAVQDAFVKALENHDLLSLMPKKALWSWLYTTAKNALTDEKRKTSRFMPYNEYDEADPAGDPNDAIMVRQLLHKLPENLIHVISLRYFGGLNAAEIGKLKGIPSATVRSQLRTAISILKKAYLTGGKK